MSLLSRYAVYLKATQPFTATFDWRLCEPALKRSAALSKLKMPRL